MRARYVLRSDIGSDGSPGLTRRQFAGLIMSVGALGALEPQVLVRALITDKRRLSWLAFQTASAEGSWALTRVEGKIPRNLSGTLYRIAPGQKENHGVVLRHLFDGDAFISGFSFRDGKAHLRARFIGTPQRLEELKAGRMIYSEFGTPLPASADGTPGPRRLKNQPNVNVIAWDNRLLGLSEGGPAAISYCLARQKEYNPATQSSFISLFFGGSLIPAAATEESQ